MGVKQFFNKVASGAKQFFRKGGSLDKTFSKNGSAEKLVNKIGAGIDTGLKVVGDVAGKVGRVAGNLAPVLMAVNPELGLAAGAIGAGARQVGGVSRQIGTAKKGAVDAFHGRAGAMIQAPKPAEPAPEDDGIGLNSPLFA